MKNTWTYSDSINLEFFIRRDKDLTDEELHQRDRQIYLDSAESETGEKREKAQLLFTWLKAREQSYNGDQVLPGALAEDTYSLFKTLALILALLAGCGSSLAYFSYSGDTPVNVLTFFTLFVVVQIVLAFILVFKQTVSQLLKKGVPSSILILLCSNLSAKLFRYLYNKAKDSTSAEKFTELQALTGATRGMVSVHGRVFYWPFFTVIQAAGLAFNTGLLITALIKITISDIAFGWQSTLQISTEMMHRAAQLVALPWSWLMGEGTGYPTLSDIEGSRIVLKEGIAYLATDNLISWWPFLLLSVFVYGLLVRLGLYGYGILMERRDSKRFFVRTPAALNILHRMQTPIVSSQALKEQPAERTVIQAESQSQNQEQPGDILRPQILLVPDECYDSLNSDELDAILKPKGLTIRSRHRFQVDYESDRELLSTLTGSDQPADDIMIIMESWMPPLVDFLQFIKELRKLGAEERLIRIKLIGSPSDGEVITPVNDPIQIDIWKNKIYGLGDPYLEISTLL